MDDLTAIKQSLDYIPEYLAFQQEYMPFVGAQVAVRVDGDLIFNHAVGMADLANNTSLTTEHLFRIASHSKTFTAVACLQLVEQGKLRLDDQAKDYVRELSDPVMGSVSVRELLSHGSGMIRDGDDSTFWAVERAFPDRNELMETIREHGKVLEPNEHFKYSNIGYSLLGLIIEAASGMPYRAYVSKNIIDTLGLEDTGPDLDMRRIDDYAKGYSSRAHGSNRIEIEHIDTFVESSATGFYSNAADLSAYFQAHLEGDQRMVSDASKRKMRQVQWTISDESQYGLGLSVTKVNGRTYYGHSGGYPGHITMSRLDPDRRLSISVLTNSADGPAEKICTAILHLIDLAVDAKHEAKTSEKDRDVLQPFVGRFATLGGVTDVANLGGRLYVLAPTSENPVAEATEMEVISETSLKCVGDKGFEGYGEVMRYTFDERGKAVGIRGTTGAHLVPDKNFVLPEKILRPYKP